MVVEYGVPVRAVHDLHRDIGGFGLDPGIVEVNGALAELAVFIHGYGDGFGRAGLITLQRFGIEGFAFLAHAVLIAADPLIAFIVIVYRYGRSRIYFAVGKLHHGLGQAAVAQHFHPHGSGGRFAQAVAIQHGRGNVATFAGVDPFLAGIDGLAVLIIAVHLHGGRLQLLLIIEGNFALAQRAVGVHFHPHGGRLLHGIAFHPRRGNFFAHALRRVNPFLAGIDFRTVLVIALHGYRRGLQILLIGKGNRALAQRAVGIHFHPHGGRLLHGIALHPRRGNFFAHALRRVNPFLTAVQIIAVSVIALNPHSRRLKHGLLRRQFARGQIQRIAAGKHIILIDLNIGGHHHAIHRSSVLRHQLIAKGGVVPLPLCSRHNFQRYAVLQRIRRQRCPVNGLTGIQCRQHKHSLRSFARRISQVEGRQRRHILCQRSHGQHHL